MTTQSSEGAAGSLSRALDEAVSRGQVRVPPYPSTALQLQAVLAKDDYGTAELVEAMRTDQVFTGNLLRLANSPMYRRGVDVTSISVAVQRVGARELTRLAMAAAMSHAAAGGSLVGLRRRVWRESLASAVVAEALAVARGLDAGETFVAALLHDVGKLLALTTLEELFTRQPTLRADDATCWAELERTHVALGVLLAGRWQLPGVLGAVIAAHHDEHERSAPLTQTVLQADAIVGLLESNREVTAPMLLALGLDEKAANEVAALLPTVPTFLNALDVPEAKTEAPRKPREAPRSDWLCLEPVLGGDAWPVRQLEPRAVVASAPRDLQPGLLCELNLSPAMIRFWAVVERCEPNGTMFDVTLKPFALSGENAKRWDAAMAAQRALAA